jgi:hypothetical protein
MLAAIKQVVQTEISKETEKQTAVLEARLTAMSKSLDDKLKLACENLKVEMRVENEKVAASLIDKFKADNENVRQEISLEVQTEIKKRSKEIELVRKDNERELNKAKDNINAVSADIDERLKVYVRNTKKEVETCEHEVNHRSRTLVKEMNEHKINIEAAVKDIQQKVAQTKDDVKSRVESIASDVKEISTAILADKQNNATEFQKLKSAINQIQAKVSSSTTPHHSSLIRN